jgi:hypothetical protein
MNIIKDSCNLKISGNLRIVEQETGKIILDKKNLVVNSARTVIASSLVGGPSGDFLAYISLGDGTSAPLETDVKIENQLHQLQVSFLQEPKPMFEDHTETDGEITSLADVTFFGIIPSSVELTNIQEAGLFSNKEFLFSRITFNALTKAAGFSWLLGWKIEIKIL